MVKIGAAGADVGKIGAAGPDFGKKLAPQAPIWRKIGAAWEVFGSCFVPRALPGEKVL